MKLYSSVTYPMNYFYMRRRRSKLWLFRRIGLKEVVFVLIFVLCAFTTYLSISQNVSTTTSSRIWDNGYKLVVQDIESTDLTVKESNSGYRYPDTIHSNTNTTTLGKPKHCLNIQQLVFDPSQSGGWTRFPLIMPHTEPNISCEDRKLFIAVVVNSDASDEKHRVLRMTIRKTWGNSTETQTGKKWKVFFALGFSANIAYNIKNRQEALQYNDVIIGNFTDCYKNIVIKTFMSHFWVSSKLSCKYVLKTDDDVYVRVSRLSRWLEKEGYPRPFYGGFLNQFPVVFRDPRSQWFVSREDFNETKWPPFSHGAFQVLSTNILPQYFNYTQFRKPFNTDDAYFGVVARDLGVPATQIPGFSLTPPKTDCELMTATAFGHMLDGPAMLKFHAGYKTLIV